MAIASNAVIMVGSTTGSSAGNQTVLKTTSDGSLVNQAVSLAQTATQTTSATGILSSTILTFNVAPASSYTMQVGTSSGSAVGWTVFLQGSLDNVNWGTILTHSLLSQGNNGILFSGSSFSPCNFVRANVNALSLGTSPSVTVTVLAVP